MGRKKDRPFNNPFAALEPELKKQIRDAKKAKKKALLERAKPKKASAPAIPDDDSSAFLKAVTGTRRLSDERGVIQKALPPGDASQLRIIDEDAEALAELVSLVDGSGRFDITDSDEFVEGCREDLDRRILQKLKRGEYAFRSHLDLHGMTRELARDAVERYVVDSRKAGHRCVLIVHGRGLNSKDNIPILKNLLRGWLERGSIAKSVLAFCTAQPHDGGAGAVYVLLRR